MSSLVALVTARAVPLTLAMGIFEAKVESILNCNRWLFATAPGASQTLDDTLEHWARSLLGAPVWRNGGVSCCEVGWLLTGSARAVRSVALRRARLWALPLDDW